LQFLEQIATAGKRRHFVTLSGELPNELFPDA